MQTPNRNGIYQAETSIEVARRGHSYAAVQLCRCEDGQYRFALDFWGKVRGFCGPIRAGSDGYPSLKAAGDAGREEMLRIWPNAEPWATESEHRELQAMRRQIEAGVRQPSLF